MAKEKYELRVGIFVLIGIVALVFVIFSVGDIYLYKPGYHLRAKFGFVSGVEVGVPVRLAGVGVGKVEGVSVIREKDVPKTAVEVLLWINRDVAVENDAVFAINTLGMFGEKYVEISPGTPGAPLLKDGDRLLGRDPLSMERFSARLEELASDAKLFLVEMRKASSAASEVFDRMNKGEGTVGKLLREEEIYYDLRDMVKDLKEHPWKLLHKPKGK